MQETLKLQFEQIFTKHYERLTGTAQSVSGLSFTLDNIVCFILFGGRELDIEDVYGDVSERYSLETFLADAREAGIETDENLKQAVSELVAAKFLHLQPDNFYYSYQATRETARMLNRIYPKMQGMSMLAYIGQTLQEVVSGRTDVESALSRFDQTLQKQGVPLPKPKIPVVTAPQTKPAAMPRKTEEIKPGSSAIIRDYVVTSAVMAKIDKPVPVSVFSDDLLAGEFEDVQQAEREATLPKEEATAASPAMPVSDEPQAAAPAQAVKLEETVVDDDSIAARIAAFEKELSLICPLCKKNSLKEQKTAAGKLFYTCTSVQCNFISWGRPHQTACPRCKNSFMVEVTDNAGQVLLKCPRATCQHRQPLIPSGPSPAPPQGPSSGPPAGGVKTVVRKRLVRRKV